MPPRLVARVQEPPAVAVEHETEPLPAPSRSTNSSTPRVGEDTLRKLTATIDEGVAEEPTPEQHTAPSALPNEPAPRRNPRVPTVMPSRLGRLEEGLIGT